MNTNYGATIKKGTEIYYTGDMANKQGFGTITNIKTSRWGTYYYMSYDDGRKSTLQSCMIGNEYKGHCNPRFVTLESYNKYKNQRRF